MQNRQVAVGDIRLFLSEREGEKGPVIAIHGLTGNHAHMAMIGDYLAPEYNYISYDVRGRGDSSPVAGTSSIQHHAEDLIELINTMDIQSPILIGHSMGAYIAAAAASQLPSIKGVVLLDGAGVITPKEAEKITPVLNRLGKTFVSKEAYVEAVRPTYDAVGAPFQPYVEQSLSHEVGENSEGLYQFKGDAKAIHEDLLSAIEFDHEAILPKIQCPALVIYAKGSMLDSPLYTEENFNKTREYTPNIEYATTESNHYTMALKHQPGMMARLKYFIDKL